MFVCRLARVGQPLQRSQNFSRKCLLCQAFGGFLCTVCGSRIELYSQNKSFSSCPCWALSIVVF